MQESNRIHVGGYEAWMEDGALTMHYHKVGQSSGMSTRLSAEETLGLLDLLAHNQTSIHHAVANSEDQHHLLHDYAHRSRDYYQSA